MPTREDAWTLLSEYTASESLRKHMLAVEACVRAYARNSGADEQTWALAALLHDTYAAGGIPLRARLGLARAGLEERAREAGVLGPAGGPSGSPARRSASESPPSPPTSPAPPGTPTTPR